MPDHFKTTVYFVVGFFTAEQREQRDRKILFDTAHAAPTGNPHILSTHQTIYRLKGQSEEVDILLDTAPPKRGTGTFKVERLTIFPGDLPVQQAFDTFMQGREGQEQFGNATAVQLCSVDVWLNLPPASK
jgi:hypothetical protein